MNDEMLLEIFDWLGAIVSKELEEGDVPTTPMSPRSSHRRAQQYTQGPKLRATMANLSSVNQRLRLVLAPRLFCKFVYSRAYTKIDITKLLDTMKPSKMLQHCVR
jgi:hypothetical protein